MIESNQVNIDGIYYRRLTESQLQKIHEASLEVLERTGVRFQEDEALALFKKAGIDIQDNNRVHIPAWRVEWALGLAPKMLMIYNQKGEPVIRLSGRKSYFGNGSDLLHIIDHKTNERRAPVLRDIEDLVHILDYLPHIDFVMSGFIPSDAGPDKAEREQMRVMLENTKKPIIYVTTSLQNTQDSVAMAEVCAGGAEELRRHPFAVNYINIAHPLRHNPDTVQKLLWLSDKGLPFVYRPSIVTRGLSTPITAAGFLTVNNVAALAGLVLSQLKREGAPFIRCSHAGGTFNMKTTVGLHSAPEVRGFNEELAHFYRLPCFGIGGTSASKCVDQQAALEAALTLITSVQAGAQLIHDIGYMDSGTTTSLAQILICHEIIDWVKKYMQGLEINDETLALDWIHKAGTDQSHISTEHTLAHFREDNYPDLLDHRRFEDWFNDGASDLAFRATRKVDEILNEHHPQELDEGIQSQLQKIIDKE
ncbi:trimethylamine methyltransferase family protein [Thermodesulfobacteriota bacterium]